MGYIPLSQARQTLGLGSSKTTQSPSTPFGGYTSLDQARTQLFNANNSKPPAQQGQQPQQKPVKTIQAPQGGFKIGDFISNAENVAQNVGKTVKDLAVKYLPQTSKQIQQLGMDPLSLKENPKNVLSTYVNGIKDSVSAAGSSIRSIFTNDTKTPPTSSQRAGAALQAIPRTVGAVISPITSIFSAAEHVQGQAGQVFNIGTVAKVVNIAFNALGEGATDISNKLVDTLAQKSLIPSQVAKDLKPGIGEIFALATQIAAGGKGIDSAKRGELIAKYGAQDAITIERQAQKLAAAKQHDLQVGNTHTPQEVVNHVVNNDLTKTPEGQTLLKTAVDAQKQGVNVKIEQEHNDVNYAAIKDSKGVSLQDYVNKKSDKFRTADEQGPSMLQKDAYKQAIENQSKIVDVIKRYEDQFGDNAPKETVGKMDINLFTDAKKQYQLLYGAKNTVPRDISTIVTELKDGLRAARTSADQGINTVPKFRLKDDFAKKGITIDDKQEAAIGDLNKKIFGDDNVQITGQILASGKALGEYKDGIIKILDGQADTKDTYFHEVVHKYLDVFTDKKEYMHILLEGDKQYKLNDFSKVEEKIAEDFINYAKDKMGVTGQLKLYFDRIALKIKKYLGNSSKIDELYNEILTKKTETAKPSVNAELNKEAQTPVGEGSIKESKAYSRVVDRLSEESQLSVNYNRVDLKADAEKAVKLITEDPNRATRVALGLEKPPEGQTETAISIALADKAFRDGNMELASQLEASRSLRQTRRGQEIVSERGRFTDNSPYYYMRELMDRRLKTLGTSVKGAIKEVAGKANSVKESAVKKIDEKAQQLKAKLKKDQRKIKAAQDIIDSLRC